MTAWDDIVVTAPGRSPARLLPGRVSLVGFRARALACSTNLIETLKTKREA